MEDRPAWRYLTPRRGGSLCRGDGRPVSERGLATEPTRGGVNGPADEECGALGGNIVAFATA